MPKRRKPPLPPSSPSSKETKELRRWRFRVGRAKKIREIWEADYEVATCERFFLGKQRLIGDESLVLNYFLATIKTTQPNLFFTNPKFFVRPVPGHTNAAVNDQDARTGEALLEAIGNQDRNLENAVRLALSQSFFRIGVLKIVYDPDMEPNPQKGEPVYLSDAAGNPVVDRSKLAPLIGPDGQPMVDPQTGEPVSDPASIVHMQLLDEQGRPVVEPDEVVTDEAYRYVWVNAKNMLLPDEGPDSHSWTWIGEEVCVPLEEAKEDERFPKRLRDMMKANESIDYEGNRPAMFADNPESETERFRYYECYDLKEKKICCFADGQTFEEWLLYDDLPEGIEDHPYAVLQGFTPIIAPKPSPWPLPHTYSWIDPQREYNIRRTQMMEGAKRSARKLWYTDSTFGDVDEAVKILQSPKDMEAALVSDPANPPRVLEAPPLNESIYRDIPLLQMDWQVVTGQSGARLSQPGADTATEATFVERAANLRDVDMQSQVAGWLSDAGKKMLQRVKATLTLDMFIQLRGFSDEEFLRYVQQTYGYTPAELQFLPGLKENFRERFGKVTWKRLSRSDLDFEADVTVVPGSSRPHNLEVERRQWLMFLQLLGQFPQLALSRELLRETASKFEYISERMLDELTALAQKMVQINANQAGRNQGNGAAEGAPSGLPDLTGLAGMISGANVRPS